jgi:two-component system sensor histidine kinase KdpD
MAKEQRRRWYAVHVETPGSHGLSSSARDTVERALRLAKDLGGEPQTIVGANVAEELVRFAQSHRVAEIIVGKSFRPRWYDRWRGMLTLELIRRSGDIHIRVARGGEVASEEPPRRHRRLSVPRRFEGYALATTAVAVAGVLAKLIEAFVILPAR